MEPLLAPDDFTLLTLSVLVFVSTSMSTPPSTTLPGSVEGSEDSLPSPQGDTG